MTHCFNNTIWVITATMIATAASLGDLRQSCADERAGSVNQQQAAAPNPLNHLAATDTNQNAMCRLPPVFDEPPDASSSGRQSIEPGAIPIWDQDPTGRSRAIQSFYRQELPEPADAELVTLHLNEVSVRQALEMLSRSHGLSILVAPGVSGLVTANLEGLQVDQALDAIVKLANLVAHREGDLIYVYSATEFPQANFQLHVFPLNFVSAIDILPVITSLLTPTGQATASSVSATDNTKAREAVVVTDRPEVLQRVEAFIRQVDVPPLQVMIEAHVMKIELTDDLKHGVNYKQAMESLGSNGLEFELKGLADANASPAVFARLTSAKIDGLLHLLKQTTDAKTLASPRVMVINGQKAHIQVGEQIPYKVVTVTETTAVESIQFLNVGVVLDVTPRISQDGRVMMRVNPKVSSGTFNDVTMLPGEATRELNSDVILEDGLGMVIGGLIQEKDVENQSKLPYLGDLRYVGRLFQRRQVVKERSEIVITLIPRIVYNAESISARDAVDAERSQTPLFCGPLNRYPRPWEPQLPDAVCNPIPLRGYGRCDRCRHQPCDCGFHHPVGVTDKPLAPLPVSEAPTPVPQQPPAALPAVDHSTFSRQGPPPVVFEPASFAQPVNRGFSE